MAYKNQAGIGVSTNYGSRSTGSTVGVEESETNITRLVVNITGEMLQAGAYVPPVVVPKGTLMRSVNLRVDEAFVLGGTTPTIQVGAFGSVATNGFAISQAQAQAVGTTAITPGAGTWALASTTGTTAPAKVAVAMGGTAPTATSAGKATLVIEYFNATKV